MDELKAWVLSHKALTALIVVLLTMVPVVQEYQIVDRQGQDVEFYKDRVCKPYYEREAPSGMACEAALERMFSYQFVSSELYERKSAVMPGFFYRKKAYIFKWSRGDFNDNFKKMYHFLQEYEAGYNGKRP